MAKKAAKRAKPKAAAKRARKPTKTVRKARPSAARKPAARKSASRKPVRRTAKPHAKQRAPQRFTVSHLRESDFVDGLRTYARYRDLGTAQATGGMVQAHVIRMVPPCTDEVRKKHFHDVEFQMVYVLKGSMTTDFEGQGPITMHAGSCWIQPPKIKHTVLDYSNDCEVLEIILPADFDTVAVA
jgi:mannose-6-phosphate isomerase-like protein (cupin superfamily)